MSWAGPVSGATGQRTGRRAHGALAGRRSIGWSGARIRGYDAALICTDHEGPDYGELVRLSRLVVDTRNATRGVCAGSGKIVKA